MNRRKTITTIALAMLLAGINGCAIFQTESNGPAQVSDLVGMVERVYVESEVAKGKAMDALDHLQTIVAADFNGDVVTSFAAFVEAIDESEQQAEKLRSLVDPMKEAAEPLFSAWSKDLDQFTSPAMRQRSQARLESTRGRYEAVLSAVEPTQLAYDAFNQSLRDHALFLGHDLNPDALAAIQDDVRNLAHLAGDLDKRLAECLLATRTYVRAAALPERMTPADASPAKPVPVSGRRPERAAIGSSDDA